MSPAQGYRRFLLFFIPQKRGQIEDMFGLCGQGAGLRFNGPGCACALFGPGFGSAYSALLGRTHGAGRWRFQWPGLRVYPFARRLVRLTLRFWVKRVGLAGGVSMGGGCSHWQRIFFLLCCRGAKQPTARFSGACVFLYNHRLAFPLPFPGFLQKTKTDPGAKARRSLNLRWPIAF